MGLRGTFDPGTATISEGPRRPAGTYRPAAPVLSVGVTVYVPTPNPTRGAQGNWWVGSKLAKQQREATALALASLAPVREAMAEGCIVTMTRVSAGTLDDDNLRPALKRIRDTVAVFLLGGKTGERDNDSRIVWLYEQAKGKRNCPAVDIEIRRRVA